MPKIFGRYPPQWLALLAGLVMLTGMYFHLSIEVQGWLNAITSLSMGMLVAVLLHQPGDKILPIITGLAKAVLSLLLALHFEMSGDMQAGIMFVVTQIAAFALATQITAPVDAQLNDRRAL